ARVVHDLPKVIRYAAEVDDHDVELGGLQLLAQLTDLCGEDAEPLMREMLAARERYGKEFRAFELLGLARFGYVRGCVDQARKYLHQLPNSFAAEYGGTVDLSAVLKGPISVQRLMKSLMDAILKEDPGEAAPQQISASRRQSTSGRLSYDYLHKIRSLFRRL